MFAYPQYTPQPTYPTSAQYPSMMPTQPAPQPNPYMAQMQAMQAQMMAMQQHMASMQASVAAAPAAAKKTRKPRTPKDPNAPKQPIPTGTQAWISYVGLIQNEINARMRAVDPTYKGVSWKDAMQEAKRLKDLGDPRYQYTPAPKAPTAAAQPAVAFTPLPLPTGIVPATAAAVPKKVVRKAQPVATPMVPVAPVANLLDFPSIPTPIVAAPMPAPMPAMDIFNMAPITEALSSTTEVELEVDEVTIEGITYLMTPKKECWFMEADGTQGAWAGIYDGTTIDDSASEPQY